MADDEDRRRGGDRGAGPGDAPEGSSDERSDNKAIREASLRERLHAQLAQLRAQVRKLNQALARPDDSTATAAPQAAGATTGDGASVSSLPAPASAPASADADRNEADDARSGHPGPVPAKLPSAVLALPSAAGGGGARPADAAPNPGRTGADRHGALVLLEVTESDLRAMIHCGLLGRADIANPAKIGAAVQMIISRWRSSVPLPPGPPPGEKIDRRSGRERRRGGPRSSSLLSYVTGSELDRRKRADRRRGAKDAADAESEAAPPANLVTLEDARAKRLSQRRRGRVLPPAEKSVTPIRMATMSPLRRRRPAANGVDSVNSECNPDETEGTPAAGDNRFTEDKNCQQDVQGRCDVLDQAESSEADPPGGGDKQDKR